MLLASLFLLLRSSTTNGCGEMQLYSITKRGTSPIITEKSHSRSKAAQKGGKGGYWKKKDQNEKRKKF